MHTSKSGQLGYEVLMENLVMTQFYGDLSKVSTEEYLDFINSAGTLMYANRIGKVLLDLSKMKNFSLSLRASAVNNVGKLVIAKAPFFILSIIKSDSLFENVATQTALKMALPLSAKFLAGQMFDNTEEGRELALQWLIDFPVPSDLQL
jgi:hypothetical protein